MPVGIFLQQQICLQAFGSAGREQYAARMGTEILAANVKALRVHLGLKQTAFAERVGTDQANVSKWERGTTEPSSEPIEAMAELAGCPVRTFRTSPWRPGSPQSPGPVLASGEVVQVQKLDLSLSMGPGTLIDEWVESEPVNFDLAFLRLVTRTPSDRLKLVTGIGDSMYPTLNWGDAILIDTTDRSLARQDGIYWINLYGAAGIKRLRTVAKGRVLVVSDNPGVADQEVSAVDLRIEGRAVWVARGL